MNKKERNTLTCYVKLSLWGSYEWTTVKKVHQTHTSIKKFLNKWIEDLWKADKHGYVELYFKQGLHSSPFYIDESWYF